MCTWTGGRCEHVCPTAVQKRIMMTRKRSVATDVRTPRQQKEAEKGAAKGKTAYFTSAYDLKTIFFKSGT